VKNALGGGGNGGRPERSDRRRLWLRLEAVATLLRGGFGSERSLCRHMALDKAVLMSGGVEERVVEFAKASSCR
jgi:hypothetical protein